MSPRSVPRWLVPKWLVGLVFGAGCASSGNGGASSRYELARDYGSRYDWKYVQYKKTHQWVQRLCELRVSVDRPIPSPLLDPKYGNLLSIQLIRPGSAQTSGLMSLDFETRDGYRVWTIRDVMGEAEMTDGVSYVVTIARHREGQSTNFDPAEVFPMPAPGNVEPETWSEWKPASALREGGFGWWAEANKVSDSSQLPGAHSTSGGPAFPFEMRYRLLLVDNPVLIP